MMLCLFLLPRTILCKKKVYIILPNIIISKYGKKRSAKFDASSARRNESTELSVVKAATFNLRSRKDKRNAAH